MTSRLAPSREQIEREVEQDRNERRKAFDEAVSALVTRVVQTCGGWAVGRDDCGDGVEPGIGGFEKAIWKLLMVVGLRAVEWYLSSRREVPKRRQMLGTDGRIYKYVREKGYQVRSIFGGGQYQASCYERGVTRKKELCVLDGSVGLMPCGGLSPMLAQEVVHLCTRMAYDQAQEVLGLFRPYVPSKRSICGIIDMVGQHCETVLDGVTIEPGEVVVIQVDARGAPCIRAEEYDKRCRPHEKTRQYRKGQRRRRRVRPWERKPNKRTTQRRTRGKKANLKKRVTVGLIYGLDRASDGSWEGGYGKFVARFGAAEEVFKRLAATLQSMGDKVKKVVFLSDGDREYRRLQRAYFPQAIAVVDFYHVCEYLWRAGETVYKEGSKELQEFVRTLKEKLLNGCPQEVVRILRQHHESLPKRGPGTKGRRKRMSQAIEYIDRRVDEMPYQKLRELGLEIGSGAIEGAVRQIVALRLDGPGMRWGQHRPQLLLHMVCIRLSGAWDNLTQALVQWAHLAHPRARMTPIGPTEARQQLLASANAHQTGWKITAQAA
jgi:hypothetical protein